MNKGKGDGCKSVRRAKVRHQINKEAVLYSGINGEKERQKNVVKSCKYIIHLCKKKKKNEEKWVCRCGVSCVVSLSASTFSFDNFSYN